MKRFGNGIGSLGLLGALALALGAPREAHAASKTSAPPGVSSPVVVIMQTGDPHNSYTFNDVFFNPGPPTPNPLGITSQFFEAPGTDPLQPLDYFTITGFQGTYSGLDLFNMPG